MLGITTLGHGRAPKAPVEKRSIEKEYMLLALSLRKQYHRKEVFMTQARVSQCIAVSTLCP